MKPLKILFPALLMALLILPSWSQVNPQPGYVVTLQGDTLCGTIDYRSERRNTHRCDFKQDGASNFVTYRPGEITSYAVPAFGSLYETLTATIDGHESTRFAACLVRGGMSLYRLVSITDKDRYILRRHDGQTLVFTGEEGSVPSSNQQERRSRILPIHNMLEASGGATHALWDSTIDRASMTRIVGIYNQEVESGIPTVTYGESVRQTSKTSDVKRPRNFHFIVMGGAGHQHYTTDHGYGIFTEKSITTVPLEFTMTGVQPKLSVGINYNLRRLASGLYLEGLFSWSKTSIRNDNVIYNYLKQPSRTFDTELTGQHLHVEFGPSYRFGKHWKLQPLVRAGIDYNRMYNPEFTAMFEGHDYSENFLFHYYEWVFLPQYYFGYYGGIGAAYRLPVGALLLYIDYNDTRANIPIRSFNVRIGYEF